MVVVAEAGCSRAFEADTEPEILGIYQLPQRSLAMSGNGWKALATEETKVASAWMEWRRFVMLRLERFNSVRMVLRSLV